jgi:hypothetical protein
MEYGPVHLGQTARDRTICFHVRSLGLRAYPSNDRLVPYQRILCFAELVDLTQYVVGRILSATSADYGVIYFPLINGILWEVAVNGRANLDNLTYLGYNLNVLYVIDIFGSHFPEYFRVEGETLYLIRDINVFQRAIDLL